MFFSLVRKQSDVLFQTGKQAWALGAANKGQDPQGCAWVSVPLKAYRVLYIHENLFKILQNSHSSPGMHFLPFWLKDVFIALFSQIIIEDCVRTECLVIDYLISARFVLRTQAWHSLGRMELPLSSIPSIDLFFSNSTSDMI